MRALVITVFLLVFAFGQAQDSTATGDLTSTQLYELKEPATYKFKNEDFTFTPDSNSIRISKKQNKEEIDFGQLRKTTDDGLYIMTSTLTEEVSFGRFDSLGNFRSLRYDRKKDSVLEEFYEAKKPNTLRSPKK